MERGIFSDETPGLTVIYKGDVRSSAAGALGSLLTAEDKNQLHESREKVPKIADFIVPSHGGLFAVH